MQDRKVVTNSIGFKYREISLCKLESLHRREISLYIRFDGLTAERYLSI